MMPGSTTDQPRAARHASSVLTLRLARALKRRAILAFGRCVVVALIPVSRRLKHGSIRE